jgi:hypothetical protein
MNGRSLCSRAAVLTALLACTDGGSQAGGDRAASFELAARGEPGEMETNSHPSPSVTTTGADTGGYLRLRVMRLMDHTGFGQPVEAARFLVPADWRMEGGIQWSPAFGCLPMIVNAQFRFVAPDGVTGLEVFPNYVWNWYDDPYQRQLAIQTAQSAGQRPCDMAPPAGAADFLSGKLVPGFRPGARIVATEPQPEVARASHASMQAYMQQAAAYGLQMDLRADAARVRINYNLNGQAVEEWISATVQYNRQQVLSAAAAAQGGMGYTSSYTLTATAQVGTRAPAGRLDQLAPLFATMIASYRPNVAYVSAVSQVMANMGNTQIQGAVDRSRIWSQASRDISDIIRQGYDRQQESQDRIAESWSQANRGLETYVDPSTHQRVQLTSGYSQVWSNGNGEYVLSNSANFEPNGVLDGNWREMQRPQR